MRPASTAKAAVDPASRLGSDGVGALAPVAQAAPAGSQELWIWSSVQALRERTQCQRREVSEGDDDDRHAGQQADEEQPMRW